MMDQGSWRAAAAATGPGDRAAAEEGVRLAYRLAGLAGPDRILWTRSPREAVRMLMEPARTDGARTGPGAGAPADPGPDAFGASVRDAVLGAPWAAERARLHAALGPQG
ncbi:hypothetical protein FGF04_33595, partial [Streptomyces apricus]